jgi:hypothetical protein
MENENNQMSFVMNAMLEGQKYFSGKMDKNET